MADFVDARSASLREEFAADICVVGAGAAGISMAIELSGRGRHVLLIEAGGQSLEGATQGLYSADQHGLKYYDLTACRLRYFGGTSNHWSGYCRENDPIDYQGRPELGVPAWPLSYDQVRPYVIKAAGLLGLTEEGFDPAHQASKNRVPRESLLESSSDALETKVFQIARNRRFRELFAPQLRRNPKVDVLQHINVTHVQLSPDGRRVAHVVAKTMTGKSFRISAHRFVLATHAIENARILLASDDVMRRGIGNEHGHVGRYFMEHPYVLSGVMKPTPQFPSFYDSAVMRLLHLNANLGISEGAMRKHGILQYYCRFNPIYGWEETLVALRKLRSKFWQPGDLEAIRALGSAVSNVPDSIRYLHGKAWPDRRTPILYELDHRIEQAPNAQSRVTLSAARDALGMRKADFTWRLNDLDVRTFNVGQRLVSEELTRLGMGQFEVPELTREVIEGQALGHYHHIGTTRMSMRPEDGVVDENCRVHGVDNLYVAGSSVFPTAGYSGPTMMIVALAIRLSEHLSTGARP